MTTIIQINDQYILEILITGSDGKGVSGLVIGYSVKNSINDLLVSQGTLLDIGDGIYKKDIILSNIGQYRVYYTTPFGYDDSIETLIVRNYIYGETVNEILANTIEILNGLNIIPNNPVTSVSELVGNLNFNNEFVLLDSSTPICGVPVLSINYKTMSIQCVVRVTGTEARIEVSNDGINWIVLHTFYTHGITNLICYKYIRAQLITGNALIKAIAHKDYSYSI